MPPRQRNNANNNAGGTNNNNTGPSSSSSSSNGRNKAQDLNQILEAYSKTYLIPALEDLGVDTTDFDIHEQV